MSPVQKSCLISDEIAFVLLMAVVYFQVRYMMSLYFVKFREEVERRDYKLKMINWENQNVLEKFASEFASARRTANERIQPLEARFEAVEGVLKGLITAEAAAARTEAARLRALLESGAQWGKKQQELQLQVDEAVQREAAWQKAASWA
jgi:hypothetical protein